MMMMMMMIKVLMRSDFSLESIKTKAITVIPNRTTFLSRFKFSIISCEPVFTVLNGDKVKSWEYPNRNLLLIFIPTMITTASMAVTGMTALMAASGMIPSGAGMVTTRSRAAADRMLSLAAAEVMFYQLATVRPAIHLCFVMGTGLIRSLISIQPSLTCWRSTWLKSRLLRIFKTG